MQHSNGTVTMHSEKLAAQLKKLRTEIAQKLNTEVYKVMQNVTIEAIAEARPKTLEELETIKGMGPKKIAQFGEEILETVRQFGEVEPPAEAQSPNVETGEPPAFTVSQFLDFLNRAFLDYEVIVQGEVTGFQRISSGAYFSLKDKEDESVLQCYIRPFIYDRLGVTLEDGMEIKAFGAPNVYKPKGRLSFLTQNIELVGEGSLRQAYEALKKKLEAEGLFARKRQIPHFVKRIGVITSHTGAALGDFRKNLKQLGLHISFYDARVEGMRAVSDIVNGIQWFNRRADWFDALVLIRGGGSLEDLQAWNNERVAREIFASRVPTICGIGHERDIPIASMVSDVAVSTPTAAAHVVNDSWSALFEELPRMERELVYGFQEVLKTQTSYLTNAARRCAGYLEKVLLAFQAMRKGVIHGFQRVGAAFLAVCEQIASYSRYLETVNPERNLRLGYSIVRDAEGRVLKEVTGVRKGDMIGVTLHKGKLGARVEDVKLT